MENYEEKLEDMAREEITQGIMRTADELEGAFQRLWKGLLYVDEFNLEHLHILADVIKRDEAADGKLPTEDLVGQSIADYILCHNLTGQREKQYRELSPLPVTLAWEAIEKLPTEQRAHVAVRATQKMQDKVNKRKDVAEQAGRFNAVLNRLSLREKLLLAISEELASMDGVNISCFSDLLGEMRQEDEEHIAEARQTLADDADLMFLCDLFELAEQINR